MRSNEVAYETNGSDRKRHSRMRDRLRLSQVSDLLRNESESREDDDVDLGMSEESEQVLESNWIRTIDEVTEETSDVTLTFSEYEGDTCSEHWKCRDQQYRDYCDGSRDQAEVQDIRTGITCNVQGHKERDCTEL